jgi:hypothetical protein
MTHPLFALLAELDSASIYYEIARYRDAAAVTVSLTLVGERVEVDVFDDGHMEVSRFPGSEDEDVVGDENLVRQIINQNRN